MVFKNRYFILFPFFNFRKLIEILLHLLIPQWKNVKLIKIKNFSTNKIQLTKILNHILPEGNLKYNNNLMLKLIIILLHLLIPQWNYVKLIKINLNSINKIQLSKILNHILPEGDLKYHNNSMLIILDKLI